MFDSELYVEHLQHRYGPYLPVGSPIPRNRYRSFKKTRTQKRADRIEALAKQLALPGTIAAVRLEELKGQIIEFPRVSFVDPDPFDEFFFPTVIAAKKAIANYLGKPLAKLTPEQMAYVNKVVEKTLNKQEVIAQIRDYFTSGRSPC